MSAYLENYLESVSSLPGELSRNFSLVRELDEQSQDLLEKVEAAMTRYKNADPAGATETFTEDAIQELRSNLAQAVSLGDEKVSLALQTYELVDKHIRRLDQDLKKFEHELDVQRKQQSTSYAPPKRMAPLNTPGTLPSTPILNTSQPFSLPAPGPSDKGSEPRSRKTIGTVTSQYDMEIDENEPKYCICQGYSAGTMVGCDNRECPIEWFHVECVGLSGPVKGKWLCPICREKEKAKK